MRFEGNFTNAFKKDLKAIGKKHPDDMRTIVHSIENSILADPFDIFVSDIFSFLF